MKLLVVDDSFAMRRIVIKALQEIGFTDIVEAGDGEEALLKMKGIQFCITDWNMPNLNGIQMVKKMKENPDFKAIPILMVTTEGQKENVVEAIKSGVNDFLVKPFKAENLKEKIQKLTSK